MKNHIIFKFIAIVLCACFLLAAVASGAGIILMAQAGLYEQTPDDLFGDYMENQRRWLTNHVATKFAASQSGISQEFLHVYFDDYSIENNWDPNRWFYTIADPDGNILENKFNAHLHPVTATTYEISPCYPVEVFTAGNHREYQDLIRAMEKGSLPTEVTVPPTTAPAETIDPAERAPTETMPTEPAPTHTATESETAEYLWYEDIAWHNPDTGGTCYTRVGMRNDKAYKVTLYTMANAYTGMEAQAIPLVELLYSHRFNLLIVLGGSLLLFAIFAVYLCCAAGRKPKCDEVKPGGLNLIPLDLYALIVGFGCLGLAALAVYGAEYFYESVPLGMLAGCVGLMGLMASLLIVAFLFALVAQIKAGGFYWLRHTVVGMLTVLIFKIFAKIFGWIKAACGWLGEKTPPAAKGAWAKTVSGSKALWSGTCEVCKKTYAVGKSLVIALWGLICTVCAFCWKWIKTFFTWIFGCISRTVSLLPLTWQWLLTAFALCLVLILAFTARNDFWLAVAVIGCTLVVLYGANSFGILMDSARRMSQGDLNIQVEDKTLVGGFKEFAGHLNALAGVAVIAAQKQMKSERMKAELVTNVSHDIKTPLTSIINYVDLLKKAKTQEEAEEYLEVLSRQSMRMKKLIEDLMEMSKASTGNMNVDITAVDAGEAVNQALGEFSDKLEQSHLSPVFTAPEPPLRMLADGRLAWRVLSNLLSNAVKYALPGTRLYIDIVKLEGKVLISLKNISREPLNVSSEELMERFVRGDTSRNTEGSGLGLNIAKSLMELQQGELQLLVDGDLFKATLIFPAAED